MRDLMETGNWTDEEQHPASPLDPSLWEVEIRIGGERVLTIGHSHLSGIPNIDDYGDTVRTCAEHLLSFIGSGDPAPCFACGGYDDGEQFMCEVCGGDELLGDLAESASRSEAARQLTAQSQPSPTVGPQSSPTSPAEGEKP